MAHQADSWIASHWLGKKVQQHVKVRFTVAYPMIRGIGPVN
jgi:hypothetical protein